MKPHLLTDSGKIFVVELPDKRDEKSYAYKTAVYDDLLKQALANKIEVAEESLPIARMLIREQHEGFRRREFWEDNHLYLIEGLKVRTEFECKKDGHDGYAVKCHYINQCDCKQYAIISIE